MFGNGRLPNIAHHSFCFYHHHPTHSLHHRLCHPPCERPHGLSEGVLITDANTHQPRACSSLTPTPTNHVTLLLPTVATSPSLTVPMSAAPPLIEGCG